jgi:hypothetical protein
MYDQSLDEGSGSRVIDHGDLYESAADVETDGSLLTAEPERRHVGKPLERLNLSLLWQVSHILDSLPD